MNEKKVNLLNQDSTATYTVQNSVHGYKYLQLKSKDNKSNLIIINISKDELIRLLNKLR